MARKKKRDNHDDHIGEDWLLPYADILTLLLAFFIVLYAMSDVDANKYAAISKAFNGVLSGAESVMDAPIHSNEESEKEVEEALKKQAEVEKDNKDNNTDQENLMEIKKRIDQYIADNQLTAVLQTSLADEGLLLTINDSILFDSGSADIRSEDKVLINEISSLLIMNPQRNIIISGHTDNVPITTATYSSNWELSVMRSVNFMKVILKNQQLDPRYFSAKGFGEYKPVADNNSHEGRQKNRRVEVLITPLTENH